MQPLDGIRVIDLTRLLPGPYATRTLAELGAEVVKIEDPATGDPARWYPPYMGDPPASGVHHLLNAGKKSVALDLRTEDGRAALEVLLEDADVLVDTFRPGVLAKLGLQPERLLAERPRLVYCALTGFGLDGPHARRPGHDIGYLARAGGLALGLPGVQVADVGGGLTAVAGILAALLTRTRTGQGGVVDVSLTESAMAFSAAAFGARLAGHVPRPGAELLDGSRPAYGVYATADGRQLAIGALEPKFWQRVVEVLGRPELATEGLAEGEEGAKARAEVARIIAERPLVEWVERFEGLEACVEPVATHDEVMRDPQLVARGAVRADGQVAGPVRVAGAEALSGPADATAPAALGPAPNLGAHTREVLEAAGVDPARVARICGADSLG